MAKHDTTLSPNDRLHAIASLLALAVIRQKHRTEKSNITQRGLALSPKQSVNVNSTTNRRRQ